MAYRVVIILSAVALAACQQFRPADNGFLNPTAPSALAITIVERPYQAQLTWRTSAVQWAGAPGSKSLFDGRCSAPSDFVLSGVFDGQGTHIGRITGTTSHCAQLTWSPAGPVGMTYGDGIGSALTANGNTIVIRYGNGGLGVDPDTGEQVFGDTFVFESGTGMFEGVSGGGEEGGPFRGFLEALSGNPVQMWMKGTIAY